jgi:lipopolysaccharide transport system ATP-binding protein
LISAFQRFSFSTFLFMSEPIITVENLSKRYIIGHQRSKDDGLRHVIEEAVRAPLKWLRFRREQKKQQREEFWALKDVSFEVKQGEVLGIIGRNGAGKSTLLKILSRITEPTTGRIQIDGRVASLLEVGTGFHQELTGRENIFLNGAILGMSRIEIKRKFDEIVAFSEIEKFLDTPVKRYSSGMYVRLAFAVAAHLEPEILIVDEVLAVGDGEFQKKCLGKMGQVSREGRTILFVSHNLEAVRKLCTRGVLLQDGRVVLDGSTDSVIARYINSETSLRNNFQIPSPTEKNAPAYATNLTIEDPAGLPANGFAVGKPWQIRVSFTVARRAESFITAIGLVSDRSIAVWTVWSKPRDLQPGDYQAVFLNERVSLCSGSYSIVVGLSSYNRSIHYVEEAATLVLSEISQVSEAVKANGDCGFIVNPMDTKIFQTDAKDKSPLATDNLLK